MVDHDANFKRLFSMFFIEFIDLFLPELAKYFDKRSIVTLDKEIFEVFQDKREADLVVKAKVRRQQSFFLIHVEAQATNKDNFERRMLKYFVGLHEKYELPVYPIVVFTFDGPRTKQPTTYEVEVAGLKAMRFEYRVIQLNRLDYREFLDRKNPVATALIAKMRIGKKERLSVVLECIREVNSLKISTEGKNLVGL